MKITFRGVIDTVVCASLTTVLVYYNHVIDPSKWQWLNILVSIAITWTMVEVFIKSYLYDQLKEDNKK
jgi:hypothetical protein